MSAVAWTPRSIVLHASLELCTALEGHERTLCTPSLTTALEAVRDARPLALVAVTGENGGEERDVLVRSALRQWPRTPIVLLASGRSPALRELEQYLDARSIAGEPATMAPALLRAIDDAERRREAQAIVAGVLGARAGLTGREQDCLRAISHGAPRNLLAGVLGVERGTVDKILQRLFRKLGTQSTTGIALALAHAAIDGCLQKERGWLRLLGDERE